MKILNEKVWWEFVCLCCGSTCQAEPSDVTGRPSVDSDGDTVGYICVVECGKCGKEHDVPFKKVTAKVERIAKDKRRPRYYWD